MENEAHYYDFHIVYSASYKVPVLYFRGYCSGMSQYNLLGLFWFVLLFSLKIIFVVT
jgi:hypothetical protein